MATLLLSDTAQHRLRAGQAPGVRHFDERVMEAMRQATIAGLHEGERRGYVAGWRWGMVCGAVAGCFAGTCAVALALYLGVLAAALQ